MKNSIIEKIVVIPSVFFDSIFEEFIRIENRKAKFIGVILNLLFAILISIPIGYIIQMILYILISGLTGFEVIEEINVFVIPLYMIVCFAGIIILNFEEQYFSLPRNIMKSYIVYKIAKPFKGIWKITIFIFSMTFIFIKIINWFLGPFNMAVKYQKEIFFIVFIISLFTTMIIYSESTKEKIKRMKRQFIVSVITFIVFIIFNIWQIIVYLNNDAGEDTIIFIIVIILGLLLSMWSAIDKTRVFFTKTAQLNIKKIDAIKDELNKKYSYKVGKQYIDNERKEINGAFRIIKVKWITGNKEDRKKIIKAIGILILVETFIILCMFNHRNIQYWISFLFMNIKNTIINTFNIDEESLSLVVIIIIDIIAIVLVMKKFKSQNKDTDNINKYGFMYKIEIALIILFICISGLIPLWSEVIETYLIVPVFIALIITIIIGKYLENKKR